ncbi:uncharacterized protein LOC116166463 [Photinus pyralis]|uniref:uncharacterized protein LOC116166463 n=1 Tax=Photinus pyralis TaxID=7054 RepID=UPI001266F6D2|nr:uncharacterized protein LOC116166463 [Photinus pyralis]
MGKHIEQRHDSLPDKQEEIQVLQTNEDTQSCRSRKSSSKSNCFVRQQLKIDAEIKKRKLAQEIVDLELAMQVSKLEQEEVDGNSESVDSGSESNRSFVQKWINSRRDASPAKDLSSEVGSKYNLRNQQINKSQVPVEFSTFITRQAMPKDLPIFNGYPTEWPNFIFQYENSTAICGYTKEENQCRLQKCLKGNARTIVESLLILPRNADKIIDMLRKRFGRPELIVFMLLDRIRNFPVVKEDKLDMFINFSDNVKNVVGTMETLNQEDHLRNPILLQELLNKLPTSQKLRWLEYISRKTVQQPKLIEFSAWLDHRASIVSQIEMPKLSDTVTNVTRDKQKHNRRDVTLTTNNSRTTNPKCACCGNEFHHLSNCSKFKSLSVDDRWHVVTSQRICFSCLIPNHTLRTCKSIKICGKNQCTKPHHILLHKDNDNNHNRSNQGYQHEVNYHRLTSNNVLLKIIPITINTNGNYVHTHALLDDASTVTLIDQDLADELHMDGPQRTLTIQWTNNQVRQQDDSRIVSFSIIGQQKNKKYQLRRVWTMKEMSLPTQSINSSEMMERFTYLGNGVLSMTNAKPKVLIGQDNWPLLVNKRIISGPWNGPALSKTLLGWVLHGNVSQTANTFSNKHTTSHVCHMSSEDKDDLDVLHDLVKQQWQIDSSGVYKLEKAMSKEDMVAQSIMDRTMTRSGGRIETGLLWKDENVVLPESKKNAMRRLICTERKMDKNEEYGRRYCQKFDELVQKKYIRKLNNSEVCGDQFKVWYLPHFGIINPNKPDKLRIVFDASAKSNGVSLNDFLLTGPDKYNSLFNILINFRICRYAFTADIKEMFLQVRVKKDDCSAQRVLFREMDRTREPDVYEIEVVFFGSTCGPCLAQEAKNKNAQEFKLTHPDAVPDIIEKHYMDDYLGGADTIEAAHKLIADVIYIHMS